MSPHDSTMNTWFINQYVNSLGIFLKESSFITQDALQKLHFHAIGNLDSPKKHKSVSTQINTKLSIHTNARTHTHTHTKRHHHHWVFV